MSRVTKLSLIDEAIPGPTHDVVVFGVALSVIRTCFRETLAVSLVGVVVGAIVAVVAVRVSASMVADLLFGITATSLTNLLVAILLMLVVALAACTLPALRATRIDPLAVLREE